MAFNLSSLGGAGWQFFDNNGNPLSGGKLYTYAAGTSTPAVTYTSSSGSAANANPIILNSAGRPPAQIWLVANSTYKLVLADANDVVLWTMDNIPGIASFATTTIAELPAVLPAVGEIIFVTNPGREGVFICRAGSPPSDPLQGIYVTSNTPSFYWERVWDGDLAPVEWFGGKADDITVNNAPIIQAMHDMDVSCKLGPGKYTFGTGASDVGAVLLSITQSGWRLVGANATQTSGIGATFATPATEILLRSGGATAIRVGPASNPGGSGVLNWVEGVLLQDFMIRRDVGNFPIQNPVTGITNAPCGIMIQYAQVCTFLRVYTSEHSFGTRVMATVACRFIQMRHLRYTSGTAPGNDFFAGFYQDNSQSTPFASGNASVFYLDCGVFSNESAGNSYTYNAGIQIRDGFTDTYVKGLETANCGYGVDAQGRTTSSVDYQTQDFEVSGGVFDGCRWAAVRVGTAGPRTSLRIIGNYCHVSNATGPVSYAIFLDNVQGTQTIQGNEILANLGNPAIGFYALNSSGFTTKGNIISDLSRPVVLENCVAFDMQDEVACSVVAPATAALELTNCQVGYLRPLVKRNVVALTIPRGVQMNSTLNRRIEVNCSSMNSDSFTSGAAGKLSSNGVDVTSTGTFNTDCLASGVMA